MEHPESESLWVQTTAPGLFLSHFYLQRVTRFNPIRGRFVRGPETDRAGLYLVMRSELTAEEDAI